ncbi:MAG: hypothetical protein P4L91_06805 [Burkholderiaceae bacterium]|nr:hypothetical protein [Burkholderiaceae bacterium]
MSTYNITATGQNIEAEAAFMAAEYPNGGYTLVTPDGANTPSLGTQITPEAFAKRLGTTALDAIYAAAASTPSLQAWIAQTWGAKYIDLADPLLATGLNNLVSATLLTAAQVTAILSAPVQPSEAA